jgi:hypothetical protein
MRHKQNQRCNPFHDLTPQKVPQTNPAARFLSIDPERLWLILWAYSGIYRRNDGLRSFYADPL